jgi:two-component system chemotaxis sensor kinase CheA
MIDAHREAFKEEAYELLSELETSLLELEERPDDNEIIGRVFRAMHTIKGSGSMFGFDDIASFTHKIETVYDKVREGIIPVTPELINITLIAKDQIRELLSASPGEAPAELAVTISAFHRLASEGESTTPPTKPSPSDGVSPPTNTNDDTNNIIYRVIFTPAREIFFTGTSPLRLLNELHSLGECRVISYTDRIPALEDINPEHCYTSWNIILSTNQGIDAIKDVFIFVEDNCELKIDVVDRKTDSPMEETYKKLGEILIDRGDIKKEQLDDVLQEKKYLGELLVEKGLVTPEMIESALAEQQQIRKLKEKTQVKEETSSIRVPASKLDTLVNLVGEMVTVQARLTQTALTFASAELASIAEEVERLTGELRDNTLNIRMLPIGTTFGRFKRLVRDLSQELGKEIELTTEGADTELDKTVIEKLNDPMVHLIRNSIDHGIETPDIRNSLGKPRAGTIHLTAAHSGGNVVIQIKDDGKGLDGEIIRAKAIEKGLISQANELSEKELQRLIFAPGFSTAKTVTSVSGRGVGMDVVKRAIDVLRGSIDIQSEKGKGTTVTVKLPLTLAIVEGLLVNIGEDHFVLPLSIVEECVELTREDIKKSHGRNIAHVRGEIVPYISLRKEFNIEGEPPDVEQIVITGANGERVGFVVDNVIGEHQTVIKNLGKLYSDIEGISGATILGNGSVALIVDVLKMIQNVELSEAVFN